MVLGRPQRPSDLGVENGIPARAASRPPRSWRWSRSGERARDRSDRREGPWRSRRPHWRKALGRGSPGATGAHAGTGPARRRRLESLRERAGRVRSGGTSAVGRPAGARRRAPSPSEDRAALSGRGSDRDLSLHRLGGASVSAESGCARRPAGRRVRARERWRGGTTGIRSIPTTAGPRHGVLNSGRRGGALRAGGDRPLEARRLKRVDYRNPLLLGRLEARLGRPLFQDETASARAIAALSRGDPPRAPRSKAPLRAGDLLGNLGLRTRPSRRSSGLSPSSPSGTPGSWSALSIFASAPRRGARLPRAAGADAKPASGGEIRQRHGPRSRGRRSRGPPPARGGAPTGGRDPLKRRRASRQFMDKPGGRTIWLSQMVVVSWDELFLAREPGSRPVERSEWARRAISAIREIERPGRSRAGHRTHGSAPDPDRVLPRSARSAR